MATHETYRGIVHGSTIELQQPLGVPDGAEIKITIKREKLTKKERKEELKSLFGSCKENAAELNEFLNFNEQQRKLERTDLES